MVTILRLFPHYRYLEAQLAESASARIAAEDRERRWQARAEASEIQRDKAEQTAAQNHKMIGNYLALQAGNLNVPYPDVFIPVARAEQEFEKDPEPRRRQAREVALDAERDFEREYRAMVERGIEE